MRQTRTPVLLAILAVALFLAAPTLFAEVFPCPSNFQSYANLAEGKSVKCSCDPDAVKGTVWGTDRYTADSSLCAAAAHAGVIPAKKGGVITVFREGRCTRIAGSERNGIVSKDWGSFDATFAFKHPAPPCPELLGVGSTAAPCPTNLRGYEGRPAGPLLDCTCAANQFGGTVWGTDTYTFDSSLCGAARHAGVIGDSGGKITVYAGGKCEGMAGSTRNGISSSNWGPYNNTFAFKWPLPNCANGKPPAGK